MWGGGQCHNSVKTGIFKNSVSSLESMGAPWKRSFTNYRRAGLLDEFYNVVLTKKFQGIS
jgi:hypothetical protein